MDVNHDWQALGLQWRDQAVPGIDLDAIGREVRRRGTRLRWLVAAETLASVIAVVLCAWVALRPGLTMLEQAIFVGLAVVVVVYQLAILWLRRRQLRDGGMDAVALVDLEIQRSRTGISYWRVSAWVMFAMWLGIYGAMLYASADPKGQPIYGNLLFLTVFYVPWILAAALFAWWRGRRSLARIARFESLRGQLRAP